MNRRVRRAAFGTAALAFALVGCRAILGIQDLEDDTAVNPADSSLADAGLSADADDGGDLDSGFSSDGCAYDDDASTLHGMIQVAVGKTFSCALNRDRDTVFCWGVLAGPLEKTKGGTRVALTTGTSSPISQIFAGDDFVCALSDSQDVHCWGLNDTGQVDPAISYADAGLINRSVTLQYPLTAAAGGSHSCVTAGSNRPVQCWGSNQKGELGTPNTAPTAALLVSGTPDAAVVASGALHSCALLSDGGVRCWGDNSYGQLGNGASSDASTPPGPAFGGLTVTDLFAGGWGTCAKTPSGVLCVGRDDVDQLGVDGGGASSVVIPGLLDRVGSPTDVSSVAMTGAFSCALTTSGSLRCFGKPLKHDLLLDEGPSGLVQLPDSGAFGRVTAVAGWSSPPSSGAIYKAMTSAAHMCAIIAGNCDDSGYVYCWGTNDNGELGNGSVELGNSIVLDGGQIFIPHPAPVSPK